MCSFWFQKEPLPLLLLTVPFPVGVLPPEVQAPKDIRRLASDSCSSDHLLSTTVKMQHMQG